MARRHDNKQSMLDRGGKPMKFPKPPEELETGTLLTLWEYAVVTNADVASKLRIRAVIESRCARVKPA